MKRGEAFCWVLLLLMLSACTARVTMPPEPEEECPLGVLSWNGLQPGVSTQEDVLAMLGEPDERGWKSYAYVIRPEATDWFIRNAKEKLEYFGYVVNDGKISEWLDRDYVYFYPDGRVYWISAVVGDRDGKFHTVQELAGNMWSQVDAIEINHYKNNRLRSVPDTILGESEVWEWDRCGLFLESYPFIETDLNGNQCFSVAKDAIFGDVQTNYYNLLSEGSYRNPESIVLAQYLFPPTTYEWSSSRYQNKLPFYLFDDDFVEALCIE